MIDLNLDDPVAVVIAGVVAPEDFILLKVLSTRDKDLEDARSIQAALGARLDADLMRDEASRLAAEIVDHDVAGRFARVLAT
jgi:hypothetical protein